MNSKSVDYLNIWLLLISFIVAIFLPFELFLFSYAILGPLHYLTEINWLDNKRNFIKSKTQGYKLFVVLAIIISIYPFLIYLNLEANSGLSTVINFLTSQKNIVLLSGFIFSVSLIFLTKIKQLVMALVFSVLFSIVCNLYIPKLVIVIGVFLPTLVHVYIFTLLFMIYGQIKAKSNPGIVSVILLIAAPLIILFLDIRPTTYSLSDFIENTYSRSGFLSLNTTITHFFGEVNEGCFNSLSSIAIKVQIFIAFAYTYHYLNWFSKTSIIGWKSSLTSKRIKYIIILWLAAVGLYFYDYVTGLTALFFLSLLHVVLEFPLNIITIRELILVGVKKLKLGAK
tara:strand:+ start:167 stop:1186 length:1020 start_codon:yes stop_codon:yes gene_type:complete